MAKELWRETVIERGSLKELTTILHDGELLSMLMAEHTIGASTVGLVEDKKPDSNDSD